MNSEVDSGSRPDLPADLARAVEFHGHFCPGLLVGWRAARAGLAALGSSRSEDEELIAIVENNSCAVDAVQVLTGATFGKGNLFFRDHGKQVFTFARRPSREAVRVALKAGVFGEPAPSREERTRLLMTAADEQLFEISKITLELPPEAEIRKSALCAACGEPVMDSRTVERNGRLFCRPCARERDLTRG